VTDPVSQPSQLTPEDLAGRGLTLEEAEAALLLLAGGVNPATRSPRQVTSLPSASAAGGMAAHLSEPQSTGGTIDRLLLEAGSFHDFLEAMPDAVLIVNRDGSIVQVNAQAERLFGYGRKELLGHPVELLVPERFRAKHVADRNGYFAEPRVRPMAANLELAGWRKDGREVPVEICLSPLRSGADTFVVSTIRDISERRRAEARLRKLDERYRTLVENIPAVTFIAALDEGTNELYVSPQIETLLGFSQKEWLENPVLWHSQLHPDDRSRWHEEFATTCSTGKPFRSIYRFLARDGRVVWVHGEAKMVRDDDGRPLFLQGVAFDITAVRQAEDDLKAHNQLLAQLVEERTSELARSNAALERFGYVIAHDLRAPLRTIKSYTQKLPAAAIARLDGDAGDHLTRIVNAADRMRIQIDDLLAYSRVGSQGKEPAPTECGAAVAAACANLQADIEESGAAVTMDELPLVLADRTQLAQLFQNLLGNALKFRAERSPKVHVSARRDQDAWVVSMQDNGIGIEPQYLERIFGLGERLHSISQYPGNGIGLATCERIVTRHGGRIWAASPGPGQGSTFHFTLPAVDD
jgi:PAS domain S-box-containing protein